MNQTGQMTAVEQIKPEGPNVSTMWELHTFYECRSWHAATKAGTHATQFVYIIQNSISFQDRGQRKASSLYQN